MMRFNFSSHRTPIGLDVGGRQIKAVQLSRAGAGWRVAAAACFERSRPDTALDEQEIRRLSDVLSRRGFTGQDIVLATPQEKLITGTMELPPRGPAVPFDRIARSEFARAHKFEPGSFELAYWDIPAPGRGNKATHVMAVACPHRDAEALLDLFEMAELNLLALDTRACAMARACEPMTAGPGGMTVLLELGWNAAVLVVVSRKVVTFERRLDEAGLKHAHRALTSQMKLAPDVADYALGELGLSPAVEGEAASWELLGEVRGTVISHFDLMTREVLASIAYTTNQYPDTSMDRLLVFGGGAMVPGFVGHLAATVGFEVQLASPLARASCPPALAAQCNASLTTAAGLALFGEA